MVSMSLSATQGWRRASQRYDAINQFLPDGCCDLATRQFARRASRVSVPRNHTLTALRTVPDSACALLARALISPLAGDENVDDSRYFEHTGTVPWCLRREWSLGVCARPVVLSSPGFRRSRFFSAHPSAGRSTPLTLFVLNMRCAAKSVHDRVEYTFTAIHLPCDARNRFDRRIVALFSGTDAAPERH